jgi:hypothetical protein
MMDLRSAEGKDVILTKLKCRTLVQDWASLTQFWPYFLHERLEENWSNSQ